MELWISNGATIICTIIAGWFALQQTRQKHQRQLEQQAEHLRYIVEKRGHELSKCIAMNMIHPNAHVCDIQDAMIKLDEATEEYETFLEKMKIELLR